MSKSNNDDKKFNYGAALAATAGPTLAKTLLVNTPEGITESYLSQKFNNSKIKSSTALATAIKGRGLGRLATGASIGVLTAPAFAYGLNKLKSEDKNERRKGLAAIAASSIAFTGGTTFGNEYANAKALKLNKPLSIGASHALSNIAFKTPFAVLGAVSIGKSLKHDEKDIMRAYVKPIVESTAITVASKAVGGIASDRILNGKFTPLKSLANAKKNLAAAAIASGLFSVGAIKASRITADKFDKSGKTAKEEPKEEAPVPESMKGKFAPFDHQHKAIKKLFDNNGSLIMAHGVGSGKGATAVYGFELLKERGAANKALVIVPTALRDNFAKSTIAKFTNGRSYQVIASNNDKLQDNYKRVSEVEGDKDYTVIGYEMFRKDPVGWMKSTGADTIIVDEFHNAQPLDAKILTPDGWVLMRDIEIGSKVIDPDSGSPINVIGVYQKGIVPIYKVQFNDGSSTECCNDHLWEVSSCWWNKLSNKVRVLPLSKIREDYLYGKNDRNKYRIRMTAPIQFSKKDLPIDPYILGVLIGDGSIVSGSVEICCSEQDKQIIEKVASKTPVGYEVKFYGGLSYAITSGIRGGRQTNLVKKELEILGLWGKNAFYKFIPDLYKYSDLESRRELLQGLMDTDGSYGSVKVGGQTNKGLRYVTVSLKLAKDVQELVQSLGGMARIHKRLVNLPPKKLSLSYEVYFTLLDTEKPFHLSRKMMKWNPPDKVFHRVITNIEYVGEKEAKCILVDSKSHLYITDDYIVTHNTRNEATSNFKALFEARQHAKNFIGLTGSLINNNPAEIASLVTISEGHRYISPSGFKNNFVISKGGKPVAIKNQSQLLEFLMPKIDYISSEDMKASEMPRRDIKEIDVPMSAEQFELYNLAMDKLGPLKEKILRSDPNISLKDAQFLFAKIMQARQLSNSLATGRKDLTLEQSAEQSPKVKRVIDDTVGHLSKTPDGQVVLYSNLVSGGVDVLEAGLRAKGITPAVFVGKGREIGGEKITDAIRNEGVNDFKDGKKKVIILSGAGAEGLSLNNATAFYALDGHFNPERILQAEARARRLGGLSHRPEDQRVVEINRYIASTPESARPGFFKKIFMPTAAKKQTVTTDKWMYEIAKRKYNTNSMVYNTFKEPYRYIRKYKNINGNTVYVYPPENK